MFTILLVVQILVSISIITLVLLQQGKGADMGAGFGAGASGTVFGSRGSGSFFTRATAILATVFFINCLLIASPLVLHVSRKAPDSVVEQIQQQQETQQKTAEQEKTAAAIEKLKGAATDLPEVNPAADAGSSSAGTPVTGESVTVSPVVEKPTATTPPVEKPAAQNSVADKPAARTPATEPKVSATPDKKKVDDLPPE
jgi:preprotein translocase subunit SecG